MPARKPIWRWVTIAGVLALCMLLWHPCANAIFSVRLALGLKALAAGANGQELHVTQTKLYRQINGRGYEALIYCPEGTNPKTAMILVAGLSELGCYHPRVAAMSRLLAHNGVLVITPDIREFRDFQISAGPMEQILFWYKQVPGLPQGTEVQETGLAGVSFSGTLVLMAAARPEVRNNIGFVAAVGPYSSLIRCTKDWFAAASGAAGTNYPTRFYAKWIIMRSALDMINEPKERVFLRRVLDNLLLQKEVPPVGTGSSAQAVRWYGLATMPETRTDPELTAEIESYLTSRIYPELNPQEALKQIRCPVFLVHGAYDDLIPPEESLDLHRRIADSSLLITPFLTHTHPAENSLSFGEKSKAALDTLVFFYRFAQVIR